MDNQMVENGVVKSVVGDHTLVFVYGTLKEGCGNHHLLEGCTKLDDAVTDNKFIILSNGCYPCMVQEVFMDSYDGLRPGVTGEVYEVDAETLDRLDWLESEGHLYKREEMIVHSLNDPHVGYRVQAYRYLHSTKGMTYLKNGIFSEGSAS